MADVERPLTLPEGHRGLVGLVLALATAAMSPTYKRLRRQATLAGVDGAKRLPQRRPRGSCGRSRAANHTSGLEDSKARARLDQGEEGQQTNRRGGGGDCRTLVSSCSKQKRRLNTSSENSI